jgi:hypothetical protein
MNSTALLTGVHLRTYKTIFQHPISHNLRWHDVHALFHHLGQIENEPNGNTKVTRNGQIIVLHPQRTKDVSETDEIMVLRHFLERSETVVPDINEKEMHWLVVIDHDEARIFRSEIHGAIPQRVFAHEPEAQFRQARDANAFSRGKDKPDPNSFFKSVAKALETSGQILIFGTGTGKSSEMDQLIAWLKLHHPGLASRIIGSLIVDEHHLTEDQLLAKARQFYAKPGGQLGLKLCTHGS